MAKFPTFTTFTSRRLGSRYRFKGRWMRRGISICGDVDIADGIGIPPKDLTEPLKSLQEPPERKEKKHDHTKR